MAKSLARSASKSQPQPQPVEPVRAPIHLEVWTIAVLLAGSTVVISIAIGFVAGVATAFLALVTGALLGAILLLWHSLRTLAGDTEIDPALDATISRAPSALDERKRRALRALKDIEAEHAIGKIDDADFASLDAEYRARAKTVIREMDDALDPHRAKAEALVRAHLEKRAAARVEKVAPAKTPAAPASTRNACPKCATTNDADATFCKKCGAKLASEHDEDEDDEDNATESESAS